MQPAKNALKQFISPYGIGKSAKWLYDYLRGGDYKNPLGLVENAQDTQVLEENPDRCLLFVGDLMGTNGKKLVFQEDIRDWSKECDHVIGNLEGPLWNSTDIVFVKQHNTEERLKDFSELAPLKKWIFSLANNHIYDYGPEGVQATTETIEKLGASWIGLSERPKITIHDVDIWAATTFSNVANKRVFYFNEAVKAKTNEDKYSILYAHWGMEFAHYPSVEQKNLRDDKLKQFHFVVGHHSHTPQPIDLQNQKGTAYSLGNLYIYFNKPMLKKGKLLKLYFRKNKLCRVSWRNSKVIEIKKDEIVVGLEK